MLGEVLKVMGNSVAQFHIHRYPVSSPTYKPEFHFPESEYPMISCQPNIQTRISFFSPDINQNLIFLLKKIQNIHRYPVSPTYKPKFHFPESEYPMISCQPRYKPKFSFSKISEYPPISCQPRYKPDYYFPFTKYQNILSAQI